MILVLITYARNSTCKRPFLHGFSPSAALKQFNHVTLTQPALPGFQTKKGNSSALLAFFYSINKKRLAIFLLMSCSKERDKILSCTCISPKKLQLPQSSLCNSEEMLNYTHLTGDLHSGWHITPNALIILGLLRASGQVLGCFPPAWQQRRAQPCPGGRESLAWVTHRAAPCSRQGLC